MKNKTWRQEGVREITSMELLSCTSKVVWVCYALGVLLTDKGEE